MRDGKKKSTSLVGPVGAALIVFALGCALILIGLATDRSLAMLLGAAFIVGAGGIAALLGERMTQDFATSQGGSAARKAREEAERASDTTHSDLTVPDDWLDAPKRD